MIPTWLWAIEARIRRFERWMNPKRFAVMAGIGLVAVAILIAYLVSARQQTVWQSEACGPIHWERERLPVPVLADASLPDDWLPPLEEGMKLLDPDARLLKFAGRMQPGQNLMGASTLYVITVEQWNDDRHGNTRHEVQPADCSIVRMHVSLPVLVLPGPVRVRIAAHELGHALGLGHSDWETNIMYPTASSVFPFAVSAHERELLEAAYLRP